jgi:aspartate kinase
VRKHPPRSPGAVVGVASEKEVLVLHAADALPFLEALDEHNVAGKQLHLSDGRLTIVVSRENLHQEQRLRAALTDRFGDGWRLVESVGAVSVVGAGINASFQNVRRGTAVLVDLGVKEAGLATSSFRITWLIDRARVDDAVRGLHQAFIETREPLP